MQFKRSIAEEFPYMRPANDSVPKPWGPLAGFWSWQYLNLLKTIKLVTSKRVKSFL